MELLRVLASLLLTEAEEGVLVVRGVGHRHIGEGSREALEDLLLALLGEEELHVTADGLVGALVDADEVAPFLGGVDTVVHDLAVGELGLLLEDSGWGVSVVDVGVVDVLFANDTEGVLVDPAPEAHALVDVALLELGLGVQVENLRKSIKSIE